MKRIDQLLSRFDPDNGAIDGVPAVTRRLSDLRHCFADERAYEDALQQGNPIIYTVASVEPAVGDGQLHYGIGQIMPGRVGDEYYLTKGHLHEWRPAAEFYIGLRGEGMMLLEDINSGESRMLDLVSNSAVYVPGFTAHRTVNVGAVPLVYLGVYPAAAGHDYSTIAEKNFRKVIVARNDRPVLIEREQFQQQCRQNY
ncbi:MAG: glucose-6-phosphate isomerase family protein [bacterium]